MFRLRGLRTVTLRLVAATVIAFGLLAVAAPPASAHAELLQSSPRQNSVAGGQFHSIALQFGALDATANFRAELLDPAGTPIGGTAVSENSRIVIPIEPLQTPGTYTVSYTVVGIDGDVSSEVFTFRFDPAADEPEGISIKYGVQERFGLVGWLLTCLAAALLGFLVHRFVYAWRAHKAAQHIDSDDRDDSEQPAAEPAAEPVDASG